MGKLSGNRQVNESGGLLDQSASGFTRIEPRISIDNGDLDIAFDKEVKPKSRPRVAIEALVTPVKEAAVENLHDVLMNAPKPRRKYAEANVERPPRSERREQGYTRVTPQGQRVSPQGQRVPKSSVRVDTSGYWQWINPKWVMGLVIVMAIAAIYMIYEPLEKLLERPLKSVVVEGEFHFISKTRATELIGQEIDNNFLRLDLMRLKHVLLDDPWVESVSLVRRWPDTLVVKIMEQKPIARWDDGFLNQRGEIVRVKEIDQLQGLPWLRGNEADAVEILQQYQDLSQLLRARGLDILALKCDNKKSWRLTLKNNVDIVIGRDQVMEKMGRFVTVYDTQLSKIWTDVAAVDVRYSNGVAVRWVENSESAKKYLRDNTLAGITMTPVPLVNEIH